VVLAATVVAAMPRVAHADVEPEPLGLPVPRRVRSAEVVVDIPGERSKNNKIVLASIAGAAVLAGAIGLYFHLDSRSATSSVEASTPTGEAWTPAHDALVERAERSSARAGVAYGVGGAILLGAIVTYIATHPKGTQQIIQPSRMTTFVPAPGGGVVGSVWRF
jgi:hypothetical protein